MSTAGSSMRKSMNQDFNYTFIWKENASFISTLYLTCKNHSLTLTKPGFLWWNVRWWNANILVEIHSHLFMEVLWLASSKNSGLYKKIRIDSRRLEVSWLRNLLIVIPCCVYRLYLVLSHDYASEWYLLLEHVFFYYLAFPARWSVLFG